VVVAAFPGLRRQICAATVPPACTVAGAVTSMTRRSGLGCKLTFHNRGAIRHIVAGGPVFIKIDLGAAVGLHVDLIGALEVYGQRKLLRPGIRVAAPSGSVDVNVPRLSI